MEPRPDTWLENAEVDALVLGTGILQSLVAWCASKPSLMIEFAYLIVPLRALGSGLFTLTSTEHLLLLPVDAIREGFYGEHEAALSLQDLVELLSRQAAQGWN